MALLAQNTFTIKRLAKDAVTYYLVPSVNIVRRSGTTNVPVSVSCVKMKQVGSDAAAVTTDHTLYKSIDGGADSVYSGAVTVGTANTITFRLKDGGGTVIASSTVVVLEDELFSKNDIAQQLGYADWAAMVAAKAGGNPIITAAGLINANIIDVETLAALEAFINALIVTSLKTAEDQFGSYIHISRALEEGFYKNFIRFITADGRLDIESLNDASGEYAFPHIYMSNTLGVNHNSVEILPGEIQVGWYAISQGFRNWYLRKEGLRCITSMADPAARFESDGIKLSFLSQWADATTGEFFQDELGRIYRKLYSDAAPVAPVIHFGTAITGTSTTATTFQSSGIAMALAGDAYINIATGCIYKCITGGVSATATWSYQGRPAYTASDVGALASDAIQYFTAAQWAALTTAQKNAIPLAVVGE